MQVNSFFLKEFDTHAANVDALKKRKKESLRFESIASNPEQDAPTTTQDDDGDEMLGVSIPSDEYRGDTNFRTLQMLLHRVDRRGWERTGSHQLEFHDAFLRATARVIYRADWATARPFIMKKHGWTQASSEVMVSTPRRFGKTFSIAIFVACLSVAFSLECVVFSPARRASRKLLERIVEFIRVIGAGTRIIEYNQEACRVKSFDGKSSLIRSFPCANDSAPTLTSK